MTPDRGAGNDDRPKPSRTPFERFANFTRRLIAVPKTELPAQERKFQGAKKKRKRVRRALASFVVCLLSITVVQRLMI